MCWGGLGGGSACQRLDVRPAMVEASIPGKSQLAILNFGYEWALGPRVMSSRLLAVENIPS